MSSLSLPRVLQQRKTSLEQVREIFEKTQGVSIAKAINLAENPVKEKHVRSAILGTFHEKCAETFWTVVLTRLPLQENRIAAWKFCHVLHKVLREGHPQSIPDSFKHVSKIEDLGKLWGHLRDCYGKLIQEYCSLLIVKINFHRRNPRIPGNLILSSSELDAIGDNDVNNYFQLCVEMFDYMDEILTLQKSIFGSLDMSRSNSMTSCGQCRLAPLIPIIQDSSQLYDCCVKLLFRLHASLPPDLLAGHRARFLTQFKLLRDFYKSASILQYFKNLIQIPSLPENPPNFLIQSDFGTYVTPVVILPPEEELPPELPETGDLVDLVTSPSMSNGNTSPDILAERDSVIEHLQNELSRYHGEMATMIKEHQRAITELNDRINSLEVQLINKNGELQEERRLKEDLILQAENAVKNHEQERKSEEEKFQKLKDFYTKLREEHIMLIRQKADVDKQLSNIKSLDLDANQKAKLEELAQELATLQASADAATEQNQALETRLEFVTKEKCQKESELQDLLSQKGDLDVRLQITSKELREEQELVKLKTSKIINEAIDIVKNAVREVENPAFSSAKCSIDYFTSLTEGLESCLILLQDKVTLEHVIRLSNRTAEFVLFGKATSNTSPNIEFGERMGLKCKDVGEECMKLLCNCKLDSAADITSMRKSIEDLLTMVTSLQSSLQTSSVSVGDLVESELAAMDRAIEEAAKKIEEMLTQSRKADSGIKLEVNEKILDSCTGLMQAIKILIKKSRILQAEIVAQGRGTASVTEFYARNHLWTEGLISAAMGVAMAAKHLLEAADKVVSEGGGKLEMVVAAVHSISASTAQLVYASKTKAKYGSEALYELTTASKGVAQATAGVLTTAKTCVDLVEQSEDFDMSDLTLYNVKRLEMEAKVKVLELENLLVKERLRLAALRKQHYAMATETDQLTST